MPEKTYNWRLMSPHEKLEPDRNYLTPYCSWPSRYDLKSLPERLPESPLAGWTNGYSSEFTSEWLTRMSFPAIYAREDQDDPHWKEREREEAKQTKQAQEDERLDETIIALQLICSPTNLVSQGQRRDAMRRLASALASFLHPRLP